MAISLPELPKEKEFEEYISAFFQSGGHYVERNIIEREVTDVLELDIIATDYDVAPPAIKLVEVKSGGWGFAEVFKVRGWMEYLDIKDGVFVAQEEKENPNFYRNIAKRLGIELVISKTEFATAARALAGAVRTDRVSERDVDAWRFSCWMERDLLARLTGKKKSHPDAKRFRAMADYFFKVNSRIFFTENIVLKVRKLYEAFEQCPRLSARTAHELIGNNFDGEYDTVPHEVYKETYSDCAYTDVQMSSFVEHYARLAILKNAVDYMLFNQAGLTKKTATDVAIKGTGIKYSLWDLVPESFKTGLETMAQEPYFHRYPVFWQWFMWVFGGFILKDYEDSEYQLLAEKTGIPVEHIDEALSAYDKLFTQRAGWFQDLPNSNIRLLKLFPVPFMGLGANYRGWSYSQSSRYRDLKLTGLHTLDDLHKWSELGARVLRTN